VASFRSDALVVSSERIWNISLLKLNLEDAVKQANVLVKAIRNDNATTRMATNDYIKQLLSWLWASVVNFIEMSFIEIAARPSFAFAGFHGRHDKLFYSCRRW
jgi:hypothetical protein